LSEVQQNIATLNAISRIQNTFARMQMKGAFIIIPNLQTTMSFRFFCELIPPVLSCLIVVSCIGASIELSAIGIPYMQHCSQFIPTKIPLMTLSDWLG